MQRSAASASVAQRTLAPASVVQSAFDTLGLRVFERGWLSSNGIVCRVAGEPTVMIDTGYAAHADLTLALVRGALVEGGRDDNGDDRHLDLDVVVNTHLHSDHCGGNAILQSSYPRLRTIVPATMLDAVHRWDPAVLTYARTDQRCPHYRADAGLAHGDELRIGRHDWQVHAAPGHDPDALMFFEPTHRVLVSGDALWEKRLAIVFPALTEDTEHQGEGFTANEAALDAIEALKPAIVIPGHGRPFTDAAGALASSRKRLAHYRKHPNDHASHARKALVMFHMLEQKSRGEVALMQWLRAATVLRRADEAFDEAGARECLEELVGAGVLERREGRLCLPD